MDAVNGFSAASIEATGERMDLALPIPVYSHAATMLAYLARLNPTVLIWSVPTATLPTR